jgi:hypothetical protein
MQHETHETHRQDHGHAHDQHGSGRSHVHAAPPVDESQAIPPSLNRLALTATLHCLTGCAIGEVLGMVIGTALKWDNSPTIALSVALAFLFGYGLTMRPLLASGLTTPVVLKLAFASDTASITIMEIVDNAIMLIIPGAMEAGLGSGLFWVSLVSSLLVAGAAAFPVNRWLIARGQGHAVVHRHHGHGHH